MREERNWRAEGGCRAVNPEVMFPAPDDVDAVEAAKQVCAGCPVRARCLVDAMTDWQDHGVWGGLSEKERRALRRSRQRARQRARERHQVAITAA